MSALGGQAARPGPSFELVDRVDSAVPPSTRARIAGRRFAVLPLVAELLERGRGGLRRGCRHPHLRRCKCPVEQRTEQPFLVATDHHRTARASVFRVAPVTARARVLLPTQHEIRREGQAALRAADGDRPVFEGLPQHLQHFTFQPLQVLQGDIKKVARTARGIEDPDAGQPALEGPDLGQRVRGLAPFGQSSSAAVCTASHSARSGSMIGRQHQPFDVGAGGEVCAQLVPLRRVQRAHQQRAEDRRLHVAPIGLRGLDQQLELVARSAAARPGVRTGRR